MRQPHQFRNKPNPLQVGLANAKVLEAEIEQKKIQVEKDGVKAVFNGLGLMLSISIPPNMQKKRMDIAVLDVATDAYWAVAKIRDKAVRERLL